MDSHDEPISVVWVSVFSHATDSIPPRDAPVVLQGETNKNYFNKRK